MARKEVKNESGGKKLTLFGKRKSRRKASLRAKKDTTSQGKDSKDKFSNNEVQHNFSFSLWNSDLIDMMGEPFVEDENVSSKNSVPFSSNNKNVENYKTLEETTSVDCILENDKNIDDYVEYNVDRENASLECIEQPSDNCAISSSANRFFTSDANDKTELAGQFSADTDSSLQSSKNYPLQDSCTETLAEKDDEVFLDKHVNKSFVKDVNSSCDEPENSSSDTESCSASDCFTDDSISADRNKESKILPFVNDVDTALLRRQRRQMRILRNKLRNKKSKAISKRKSKRQKLSEENLKKLFGAIQSKIKGNRIVEPNYYWDEVKKYIYLHTSYSTKKCKIEHIHLERESDYHGGLRAMFHFRCSNCNQVEKIWTTPKSDTYMDLNDGAVLGALCEGIGFTQVEGLFAAMDIPFMTSPTFRAHQNALYSDVEKVSNESMKKAAEEEARLARQAGDIDKKSGLPFITVIVDGSWIKRSYKNKYDSLSGVGAIIGLRTGKVLFVGIKNKYCYRCHMAQKRGKQPKKHLCVKNFDRNSPSTLMESEALLEGFAESADEQKLIYRYFIGDGDSNFLKKLSDNNPYEIYGIVPRKIECVNHLLRNFTSKIIAIGSRRQKKGTPIRKGFVPCRDLVKNNALTIRNAVLEEIDKLIAEPNKSWDEKLIALRNCIANIPSHVFGEHKRCKQYGRDCLNDIGCNTGKETIKNYVPYLKSFGFYSDIEDEIKLLCTHCDSLLHKMTNNKAESFNSIICKEVSGKRINYTASNQYDMRVRIAVVQHNTQQAIIEIYQSMNKYVPDVMTDIINARKTKIAKTREERALNGRKRKHVRCAEGDKFYGKTCEKPDLSPEEFEILRKEHDKYLNENLANRDKIEEQTRDQSVSEYWHTLRKKMLTASNFGMICKGKLECHRNKVKNILYPGVQSTPAMQFGIVNEPKSRREFSKLINKTISPCGLFIDGQHPMLGASPDGIIDAKTIVELKNPMRAVNMSAEEVLKISDLNFIDKKTDGVKKEHNWHYQIQGQMHITGAQQCYLVLRTEEDLIYRLVQRDDKFWKEKMEPKLLQFYNDWMLPEILDSRYKRNMPIREPSYVTEDKSSDTNVGAKEKGNRKRKNASTNEGSAESNCHPAKQTNTSEKVNVAAKRSASSSQVQETEITDNQEKQVEEASAFLENKSTSEDVAQPENFLSRVLKNQANKTISSQNANYDISSSSSESDGEEVVFVSESYDPENWDDEMIARMCQFMEREVIEHKELKKFIRNNNRKLTDDCVDAYLLIVQNNSDYEVQSTLYINFLVCVSPARTENSVAILGGECTGHWRFVHYDGSKLRVYDSLASSRRSKLQTPEMKYVSKRFPNITENDVIFVRTKTRQPDGVSCGVYSCALLTYFVLNGDPSNVVFSSDVTEMRKHFYEVLKNQKLENFPIVSE